MVAGADRSPIARDAPRAPIEPHRRETSKPIRGPARRAARARGLRVPVGPARLEQGGPTTSRPRTAAQALEVVHGRRDRRDRRRRRRRAAARPAYRKRGRDREQRERREDGAAQRVEHLSARISASAVREFRSARARRRRRTVISRQPAGQCVMVQVLFRPSGAQQWARSAAAASSRDRHAVRIERIGRTLDAARLLGSHLEWSELRRSNSLQQKLRRNLQTYLQGPFDRLRTPVPAPRREQPRAPYSTWGPV